MRTSVFFSDTQGATLQESTDKVTRCFDALVDNGIQRVVVPLLANYSSLTVKNSQDRWGVLVEAARKRGLEIFGEIPCFYGYNLLGLATDKVYQPGVSSEELTRKYIWPVDKLLNWHCPSNTENHDFFIDLLEEFLSIHSPDGIFLDMVRYPNSEVMKEYPCLCRACSERRAAWLGHEKFTPAELVEPTLQFQEIKGRCEAVKSFVKKVRLRIEGRKVRIGLFARARYLEDALCEGQDWVNWCEEKLLDIIAPMSYTQTFGWHISQFARIVDYHRHLLAGKAVEHNEAIAKEAELGELSSPALRKQIEIVREANVAGLILWGRMQVEDYSAFTQT